MNCPNYDNCQLIHLPEFLGSKEIRDMYMKEYCTSGPEHYGKCKRLTTYRVLHFCPEFVLPDTKMELDEIIERFDQSLTDKN